MQTSRCLVCFKKWISWTTLHITARATNCSTALRQVLSGRANERRETKMRNLGNADKFWAVECYKIVMLHRISKYSYWRSSVVVGLSRWANLVQINKRPYLSLAIIWWSSPTPPSSWNFSKAWWKRVHVELIKKMTAL